MGLIPELWIQNFWVWCPEIFTGRALLALPLSLMAQVVQNPPSIWETWVLSLGWEEPLEESMAMYFSSLAWRLPWTVGCNSWGHKELDTTEATEHANMCICFQLLMVTIGISFLSSDAISLEGLPGLSIQNILYPLLLLLLLCCLVMSGSFWPHGL